MHNKKTFVIFILFLMFSSATVGASSLLGDFEGYSRVRIEINNVEKEFKSTEVPGFIVKGTTVLPLRDISEALQALVFWDNTAKKVEIMKPNVHMIVASEIAKDYSLKAPFGVVKQGKNIDFVVLPQIDNLQIAISSMRLRILSPSGKITLPVNKDGDKIDSVAMTGHKDSFWYPFKFEKVSFDENGEYTVRLEMKLLNETEYRLVSMKTITSE